MFLSRVHLAYYVYIYIYIIIAKLKFEFPNIYFRYLMNQNFFIDFYLVEQKRKLNFSRREIEKDRIELKGSAFFFLVSFSLIYALH